MSPPPRVLQEANDEEKLIATLNERRTMGAGGWSLISAITTDAEKIAKMRAGMVRQASQLFPPRPLASLSRSA
eukprot:2963105-Prymnesium_polylepis.1